MAATPDGGGNCDLLAHVRPDPGPYLRHLTPTKQGRTPMRRLGMATAAAALFGSLAFGAAPAQGMVCDPVINGVCVIILADRGEGCPGGYRQLARIPDPVNQGSFLI